MSYTRAKIESLTIHPETLCGIKQGATRPAPMRPFVGMRPRKLFSPALCDGIVLRASAPHRPCPPAIHAAGMGRALRLSRSLRRRSRILVRPVRSKIIADDQRHDGQDRYFYDFGNGRIFVLFAGKASHQQITNARGHR
jgi:hypothetical protein